MNFSAQGYADLTALLQPDIAVLEGGYAIEGALPYVNVGIILAMAGMDYSKVKEPDYDPDRIRQQPDVTRQIEKTGEAVLTSWQQIDMLKEQFQGSKVFDERTRNVFYDTDGIFESQQEKIRICQDCAGALQIFSSSDKGSHILAVHIPRKACKKCREIGYQWYETAKTSGCEMAFLQDRTDDTYHEQKYS